MKYIIFRRADGIEFPVLFAGFASHADIGALFAQDRAVPMSAGFVRIHDGGFASTHDRSTSLNLSPRPGDAMFIGAFYRATLESIGVRLSEPGRYHISEPGEPPRVPEPVPATACVFCPKPDSQPLAARAAESFADCPDCPARPA